MEFESEDIENISRNVLQEELGEVQTAIEQVLQEVINPVNYRATIAYSLADLMFKFLERDPLFNDYIQAEMAIAETDPERMRAVYEWLQKIKPDGPFQGPARPTD